MPCTILFSLGFLLMAPPAGGAASSPPQRHIYIYKDAEKARRIARTECKPLVVHFVPDSALGADQLAQFYDETEGVPQSVLDAVVVVIVPSQQFAAFARQLGIEGPGGFRTISAYDLEEVDPRAVPTCRSGFR